MAEWRIHLGVHKTATTHMQAVFDALDLPSLGIDHVPVPVLRPATDAIFRPRGLRRRLMRDRPPPLADALSPFMDGRDTAILSEENWIGEAWEGAAAPPYPALGTRLTCLAALPDKVKLSFFLAIRHPGDFATSVIAEAVRHHPGRVDVEKARKAWLGVDAPWSDLVKRLQARFPGVPLTVWRYEDYRANARAIVETVLGRPIVALPDIADPVATKRPSAKTVERLAQRRWPPGGRGDYLEGTAGTGGAAFTLFSDDEQMDFDRMYQADIARLRGDYPGALLEFDSPRTDA